MTREDVPADFGRVAFVLRDRIAHGWWKLNDDRTKTVVGSPPHLDLSGAVLSLDGRFPVPAHISMLFITLARIISDRFPDRAQTQVASPYDARIVVMEFNDHPLTNTADVLSVLADP